MDEPGEPSPADGEVGQRSRATERAGDSPGTSGPAAGSPNSGRGAKGRGGANPPPARGGPARRNPPFWEGEGRRPRSDARRETYAFGDEIERAFCAAFHGSPPETFPVTSHEGLATRRPALVDRRTDAMLFCDGAHAGLHVWPDGEVVEQDAQTAPPPADRAAPAHDGGSVELGTAEEHELGRP